MTASEAEEMSIMVNGGTVYEVCLRGSASLDVAKNVSESLFHPLPA